MQELCRGRTVLFENCQFDYVQDHLRILSGFYGVLKPMDGVTPYRLEMQAKAEVAEPVPENQGRSISTSCIL